MPVLMQAYWVKFDQCSLVQHLRYIKIRHVELTVKYALIAHLEMKLP